MAVSGSSYAQYAYSVERDVNWKSRIERTLRDNITEKRSDTPVSMTSVHDKIGYAFYDLLVSVSSALHFWRARRENFLLEIPTVGTDRLKTPVSVCANYYGWKQRAKRYLQRCVIENIRFKCEISRQMSEIPFFVLFVSRLECCYASWSIGKLKKNSIGIFHETH